MCFFFFFSCVHAWPAAAVLTPLLSRCVDSSSSCFVKFSACHCFQFSLGHMFWCRKKKKKYCAQVVCGCQVPLSSSAIGVCALALWPLLVPGRRERLGEGGRVCCVCWGDFSCWAGGGRLPVGAPLPASTIKKPCVASITPSKTPGEQVPRDRLLTLPACVLGCKVQRESVQTLVGTAFFAWQCVL